MPPKKISKPLPHQILELELIRGNQELVRRELRRLSTRKIPRLHQAHIAGLAVRANVPELAIKVLYPLVRSDQFQLERPTELELANYAGALVRLGAYPEAETRLEDIDEKKCSLVLFYRAMALVAQWRYRESIPLLKAYLECDIDDYQRNVASVNLAGALTFERQFQEGDAFLTELLPKLRKNKERLLFGAALMFSAQSALKQESWTEARNVLDLAGKIQIPSLGLESFFWRKWNCYYYLLTEGEKHLSKLSEIRTEADRRGHWESVRDCDRMACLFRNDADLYRYLWFGTPHNDFKRWLAADFSGKVDVGSRYLRLLGEARSHPPKLCLLPDSSSRIRILQEHKALRLLTADFYRPTHVAHLFYLLAPGEFFHPQAAPARVYTAITRLRRWLKEKKIDLKVLEENGAYRLTSKEGILLEVGEQVETDKNSWQVSRLRQRFGVTQFQVSDAASALCVSLQSAGRLLETILPGGEIKREGKARATRYSFCEEK